MTAGTLWINGNEARALLGFGRDKFRRLVRAGVIPSWTDPGTGTRYYSPDALRAWAAANGEAA